MVDIGGSFPIPRQSHNAAVPPAGRPALLPDAADRWAEQYAADEARLPVGAKPGDPEEFLTRMRTYAHAGAALDLEDDEPGIRCVAAPMRDASRAIVDAVGVSATTPYMPDERMRGQVPVVPSRRHDLGIAGVPGALTGAGRIRRGVRSGSLPGFPRRRQLLPIATGLHRTVSSI